MPVTYFSVSTEAQLNTALQAIDQGGPSAAINTAYTIDIVAGSTITEGTDIGAGLPPDLYAINLDPGASVSIVGNGGTLDGANAYRGLFVLNGTVAVQDLTIANAVAQGGNGGNGEIGGGGGAGLGGGLFVAGTNVANGVTVSTGGTVTLTNVSFLGNTAAGGAGGEFARTPTPTGGSGGGGGLGGAGGAAPSPGGVVGYGQYYFNKGNSLVRYAYNIALYTNGGGGGLGAGASGGQVSLPAGAPLIGGGAGIAAGAAGGGGTGVVGYPAGSGGVPPGGAYGGGGGAAVLGGSSATGGGGINGQMGSFQYVGIGRGYYAAFPLAGAGGFGGGGGGGGYGNPGTRVYVTYQGARAYVIGMAAPSGTFAGGQGGFGGGGGGGGFYFGPGGPSPVSAGGAGGFGGGGGGGGGTARSAFGGGAGGNLDDGGIASGGGGLGAGGAIFVESGGVLSIGAGTLLGNTVSPGASGSPYQAAKAARLGYSLGISYGQPGSAFGSGIFIQGANQAVTLAPTSGTTLTISDVIADQNGSDPGAATWGDPGTGALVMNGAGTVVLTAANTFTGAITLNTGTLQVGAGGTAGSINNAASVTGGGVLAFDNSAGIAFDQALSGGIGVVQEGGGTLTLGDNNSFTGGITMNAGTVELGSAAAAGSGAIIFAGADTSLRVDSATAPDNVIANFSTGDVIDLHGIAYNAADVPQYTASTGELDIIDNSVTVASLFFGAGNTTVDDPFHVSQESGGTGIVITNDAPCFLRGTRIRTEQGDVAVEQLRVGDRIVTLSGERLPIIWIGTGRRRVTPAKRTAATPVIVRKGAIADNVPYRDLRITKGHALFLDDALIPVEFLVNHRSIQWDDRAAQVEFYHIELERHGVLLADGAPAESYRDDGNRALFDNANNRWDQPAKPPCAPVLTGGPVVDVLWRRLLDRAGPRPGIALTDEADLHLLADGLRIDGRRVGRRVSFALPRRPSVLRIVSRAGTPAELGIARDARSLGVAVRQIRFWQGRRVQVIDASDPSLTHGFHQFEADEGIRWTDGDARLAAGRLLDCAAPCVMELVLGGATRYPLLAENRGTPKAARTGFATHEELN